MLLLPRSGTLNWFSVALRVTISIVSIMVIVSFFYVLASPIAVLGIASFLALCRMLTANHCPINVQHRICMAAWVRNGHSNEVRGVPSWIARFAAEEDMWLCCICFVAVFFSTVTLMVLDFSPSVALERPMWEQSTLIMCLLIPHLAALVVIYLRGVRNDLMDRVCTLAALDRAKRESFRKESE